MWLLYVVMAVVSAFEMIFKVGYVAAVPSLVEPGRVVEANSLMETTNAISYVAGPALAGLVSGLFGPTAAITANAVSFGVSLLGLAMIRLRTRDRPATRPALREGFLVGAAFIWRTPVLRSLTLLLAVITFLSLGMTDVVIYYVRHGLGQGDRTVGYVLAVSGVGTSVAAYLTATLRRSLGFGTCWLGSYVLCGFAVALAAMSHGVGPVAVAVFGYSFGMALAGICSMSLRQQVTPDELLGCTTAAFWTLHGALAPLGAAVLTALVQHLGVRGPLLAVGLVFLTVVAVGVFTPIRQREPKGPRSEPVRQVEGGGT